ncbi:uncharacterized protein MELLADRAFT_105439 [Melampsora larici-populina 98AG31]|uniref:Uncharacterized protein n=1 Tax=Melampsora larici-populina (strain 98AG31 / pathotype 3-4-7) TaxID=747676 RepID=F4RI48_MELLP|nr:uncharacterized protein MELLADRAFT_105439 [Melampsora larici-populina 98AG31]EGG08020.1 hypothetical protein MELLADRAFT_105439 [Melampsora larici-populina 98AG31]
MIEDTNEYQLPPPMSPMPAKSNAKRVFENNFVSNKAKEAFAGRLFRDKDLSLGQAFTFGDMPDDDGTTATTVEATEPGQTLCVYLKRPTKPSADQAKGSKNEATQPKAKAKAKPKGKKKK